MGEAVENAWFAILNWMRRTPMSTHEAMMEAYAPWVLSSVYAVPFKMASWVVLRNLRECSSGTSLFDEEGLSWLISS